MSTGSRGCGFIGHIRRHGFILLIVQDRFFMPRGDASRGSFFCRFMTYDFGHLAGVSDLG